MPTIYVPAFGIAFVEGGKPVFLQIYMTNAQTIDTGIVVAEDEEEAMKLGRANGHIVSSVRIASLFSRLRMLTDLEKMDIDKRLDED